MVLFSGRTEWLAFRRRMSPELRVCLFTCTTLLFCYLGLGYVWQRGEIEGLIKGSGPLTGLPIILYSYFFFPLLVLLS